MRVPEAITFWRVLLDYSLNSNSVRSIVLQNSLPRVFKAEPPKASEVWLQTNLHFDQGYNYLVSAESGAGKSSLCAYIYGYRRDYEGTILFDDKDLKLLTARAWCEIRRNEIAYLPQDLRLFPELTASDNVLLKNSLTQHKTTKEIRDLFEVLGIMDKWSSPVGKLSIGQQQRVAIIRLLCQRCQFYLLDEPVSHLDEINNRIVARLIQEEAQRQGATIIATSVGNPLLLDYHHTLKL